MATVDVTIANFNIRATPPMLVSSVLHDLRKAKELDANIIAWQELAKFYRYKRALRSVFPHADGWRHLLENQRNMITIDVGDLYIVKEQAWRLTEGTKKFSQPPRYSNQVTVQDRDSEFEYDHINSHFSNGGYNGVWRPKRIRMERKHLWDAQFAVTTTVVHNAVDEGRTVFGSGDYNRRVMEKFHPRQKWLIEDGIMKMWVVPAKGVRVEVEDIVIIPDRLLKTDHSGLYCKVKLHYGRA